MDTTFIVWVMQGLFWGTLSFGVLLVVGGAFGVVDGVRRRVSDAVYSLENKND